MTVCGGCEWRTLRTDRKAGPAELSYCDITLNTSFITFQVEELGCGGGVTEKDPLSVREGGGEKTRLLLTGSQVTMAFYFSLTLKDC